MGRRESPAEAWERMRNAGQGRASAQNPPPPEHPQNPPPKEQNPPALDHGNGGGEGAGARPYWERESAPPREHSNGRSRSDLHDASAGELVQRLTEQTKTLVRQEMQLAQAELKEKGKKAGIGLGMFGAGGLAAFFAVAVLLAAMVLALSAVIAAWLAAVIVGTVLLLVAGASALMGKKKVEGAVPPAPEQAVDSVKRDVDTIKRRARR